MTGTVLFVNADRNFGFIQPDGTTEREDRVHFSPRVFGVLAAGTPVQFDAVKGDRGTFAVNVEVMQ
jgi:cold shock CspA family protein